MLRLLWIHDLLFGNLFAVDSHRVATFVLRFQSRGLTFILNVINEHVWYLLNKLQESVLVSVRYRQVLSVARLRLENDLDAFVPFHLLAKDHDVFELLHAPHVCQIQQSLQCCLISS